MAILAAVFSILLKTKPTLKWEASLGKLPARGRERQAGRLPYPCLFRLIFSCRWYQSASCAAETFTKFSSNRRPTCWLFSGWNCTAAPVAQRMALAKGAP